MSQPKYIKGLPAKEYHRAYRLAREDYFKKRRQERGQYHTLAVALHRKKYPERVRLERAKRRANSKGVFIAGRIDVEDIHNWASMVCGICLEPVIGEYQIDHIVPLSKGGPHIASNLQIAHSKCNRTKGDN
jgi:5-methylcytosine-specific restriction endonuclease McrA